VSVEHARDKVPHRLALVDLLHVRLVPAQQATLQMTVDKGAKHEAHGIHGVPHLFGHLLPRLPAAG